MKALCFSGLGPFNPTTGYRPVLYNMRYLTDYKTYGQYCVFLIPAIATTIEISAIARCYRNESEPKIYYLLLGFTIKTHRHVGYVCSDGHR